MKIRNIYFQLFMAPSFKYLNFFLFLFFSLSLLFPTVSQIDKKKDLPWMSLEGKGAQHIIFLQKLSYRGQAFVTKHEWMYAQEQECLNLGSIGICLTVTVGKLFSLSEIQVADLIWEWCIPTEICWDNSGSNLFEKH